MSARWRGQAECPGCGATVTVESMDVVAYMPDEKGLTQAYGRELPWEGTCKECGQEVQPDGPLVSEKKRVG